MILSVHEDTSSSPRSDEPLTPDPERTPPADEPAEPAAAGGDGWDSGGDGLGGDVLDHGTTTDASGRVWDDETGLEVVETADEDVWSQTGR